MGAGGSAPTVRAPTMADVAARAGVSRALVSTVFRNVPGAGADTRERVLQAAADLGYRMDNRARLLRRTRTQLLGVMFRLHDGFHTDLVEALYARAESAGYELVLSAVLPEAPERPENRAVDTLLDNRCEALLLIGPQMSEEQIEALSSRIPTVVLSRPTGSTACDVVRTDDVAVIRVALDHLHGLGHRAIAHVDGGTARGSVERRRAYEAQMQHLGLGDHVDVVTGGLTATDGMAATRRLLTRATPPSAIIAFNDAVAIGSLVELQRAGIEVPSRVSVIGYDDVQMSAMPHINLTTVGQDVHETAKSAVARAVARLDGAAAPGHSILVPPYLAVRGTTTIPGQPSN